jgi:cyclohexyl-isocyanide hydratase
VLTLAGMNVGILAFPRMTQLDAAGPFEVLARLPGASVRLVARDLAPVTSDSGLVLQPTVTFAAAAPLDVVCVPGGPGVDALMDDPTTLAFLQAAAREARYVTSVCTGALVLGAAGLLRGYRATTHWLSLELLAELGAIPVRERIVVDRNRITGGGVTAGIDFGLTLAAQLCGEDAARRIALGLEYAPSPPFPGSPRSAAPALVAGMVEGDRAAKEERRRLCLDAAARRGPR